MQSRDGHKDGWAEDENKKSDGCMTDGWIEGRQNDQQQVIN